MRIALYQPDIPQNAGAMVRLCACLGLNLDVIEPCGFVWNQKKMDKVALDYSRFVTITKHISWDAFREARGKSRIILMTTKASKPYTETVFREDDILLAGRESSGVPDHVHDCADARVLIPMSGQARSLNIVNATSMIAGEALRQTRWSA